MIFKFKKKWNKSEMLITEDGAVVPNKPPPVGWVVPNPPKPLAVVVVVDPKSDCVVLAPKRLVPAVWPPNSPPEVAVFPNPARN